MLENSKIYQNLLILNESFVDDHDFSFTSIDEEFDFVFGNSEKEHQEYCFEWGEADLFLESSQNFY